MAALAITSPLPQFFDLDGKPLQGGRLYFGQVGQNPETSPITVYWDDALTQPAAQPIRTLNGYVQRSGKPAQVFSSVDYSLTVRDRRGQLIVYVDDSSDVSLASAISEVYSSFADSADPAKGAAQIGYRGRTLRDRLDDVVNIRDYGGRDDWNGTTGTNNFTAIQTIIATFPAGCRIVMPRRGTGVYYTNGSAYYASLAQFILDPDDGVSAWHVGTYCPLTARGMRTLRTLPVRIANNGSTYYLGAEAYRQVSDKRAFMGATLGEAPTLSSITMSGLAGVNIAWPNGPVTNSPPTSAAPDSVTWSPASGASAQMIVQGLRPGSELSAYAYDNSGGGFPYAGTLVAGVITDAGFAVVRQDVTGGNFILSVKSGASALVETGFAPPSTQVNYRFYKGLIAVRIYTSRSFGVLVNGVEMVRCSDAGGVILQAGMGPGFATNGNAISIAGMSVTKRLAANGVKPLKIVTVGDSITDKEVPGNWPDYMRQYLAGAGGAQILTLNNIAVSGDTSTAQTTALLATNITGYDYCLIQIGVNDIQGAVAVATLITNITSMVAYCRTNNVVPIVGLPTMFYGQTESAGTGNTGQATTNNDGGSPYRATLLRYLASAGVAANLNTLTDMGAIVPALLTGTDTDPMVADNIHPSAFGRMVLGWAWAKAVIGQAMPRADKSIRGRPSLASWTSGIYGTTALPTYDVQDDLFSMAGNLSSTADPVTGDVIMTLPEVYRPATEFTMPASVAGGGGTPNGVCQLQVATNGQIKVFVAPAGTRYIYMGGLQFPINS